MNVLVKLLCSALLLVISLAPLAEPLDQIQTSRDWSVEASSARGAGIPIMVIFTAKSCGYCTQLRDQVLQPLLRQGALKNRVLIREFDIDSGGKITDFDGERIRSRIFVKRYDIYATPTVVLVDHLGRALTDPIVGFNGPEAYTEFLDHAISSAVMSLAALSPRHAANLTGN
ncbi:MAG: thioredoxin fold domain-containing protein [Gammaproteobacteria bacterium]|nr:thioredoxin fold domain-containing protein [Gammaproteobacteria bacterium]